MHTLPYVKLSIRPRSGQVASMIERPVSDELPAVEAHRFSNASTAASGRLGEFANGSFGAVQFAKPGFD